MSFEICWLVVAGLSSLGNSSLSRAGNLETRVAGWLSQQTPNRIYVMNLNLNFEIDPLVMLEEFKNVAIQKTHS